MKKIQIALLILILASLFLIGYIIYLMSTGGYHSPLCVDAMLIEKLGVGRT